MSIINIPFFNDIDTENSGYESDTEINGQQISLYIHLDNASISNWVELYKKYANNLPTIEKKIRSVIKNYYPEQGGMVNEYFTYYQEQLEKELHEALEGADKSLSEQDQILSLLKLNHIGFYLDENNFATWDFMLLEEFSDEILVIITDGEGEILDITWES